ncbi:hypothetical protein APR08_006081 [Nocardia amikacinitolerans]|nr:hypothetical protein [Nocardia amikacinitolerans]
MIRVQKIRGSVGLMTGTAPSGSAVDSPRSVTLAVTAFVIALLAGVGEALARTAMTLERSDADVPGLAVDLTVRFAIYLLVLAVVMRMARGDRVARLALALGIGVLGLASLLVEPVTALLSGEAVSVTPSSLGLGMLRAIHVLAVFVAIPAMYAPDAREHFARRATA